MVTNICLVRQRGLQQKYAGYVITGTVCYYPEQKILYATEMIPLCGTGPVSEESLFIKK